MTSKGRPPKPIESFGPEIFQSLIEGAKRKVEFQLPYRKAVQFRQRANQLRAEMRRQNHEQYSMASQAKITISWPEDIPVTKSSKGTRAPRDINTSCTVTIAPSDSEFTEVLRNAGVTVPEIPENILPQPEGEVVKKPRHEDDILAAFLRDDNVKENR